MRNICEITSHSSWIPSKTPYLSWGGQLEVHVHSPPASSGRKTQTDSGSLSA